jgi:GT2 family glycosyltransferase
MIRLIQFVDGDCQLDDEWLETASNFIAQRTDVAIVCGRRRELYPEASVYNKLFDLEWNTPIGQASACGGDSLVRTEAFEAVGGFRAQLIAGEEPELCLRLRERGWKIWRIDAEMTRHDAAMMQFKQWWLRTVRSGFGAAEVSLLHWRSKIGHWNGALARSIIWSGALPLILGLAALLNPLFLGAILVYPAQIFRLALSRGIGRSESWIYGTFMTIGKFAEMQGILLFAWRLLNSRSIKLIEYK